MPKALAIGESYNSILHAFGSVYSFFKLQVYKRTQITNGLTKRPCSSIIYREVLARFPVAR